MPSDFHSNDGDRYGGGYGACWISLIHCCFGLCMFCDLKEVSHFVQSCFYTKGVCQIQHVPLVMFVTFFKYCVACKKSL